MNQILAVENKKKEKKQKRPKNSGGPVELGSIVKFFAIFTMVFGILMICSGSYAIYLNSQTANRNAKPTINVVENGNELELTVSHSRELVSVTYKWNNEEEEQIQTNGNKQVKETIEIPSGTNTLNIYAKDINGQEVRYEQSYTIQGDINIEFAIESNGLKITTTGKEELSYMTYRWDEEEETRVDINNTTFEQTIEIPKGQHTLTVVVVDINNKTETKEQEVKGVTKPDIKISLDQENGELGFLVTVTDEEGLRRIEFTLNEEERYKQEFDDNTKEFSYKFPIKEGENKILVKAYNINDVTEEAGARFQN